MKVAVLSDIHGNLFALEAVLQDAKKENCEKFFCLGDLAMAGPLPEETVAYIMKLNQGGNWEIIQGNTDKILAEYSDEMYNKVHSSMPVMANAARNDNQILSDKSKSFLADLPASKEISIMGTKVLLVHGSPRKNDENITPDLPLSTIEDMLVGVDANLIFCGHTHTPCGYQTSTKQTVVNDGSVGRPFTPKPQACYVVAEFGENSFNIVHKFVDYDNEKAAKILENRNFEGADKLAKILLKPEVRHL